MSNKPIWVAGIARGHNAGICLLKDDEIIFSIEEERFTRTKYDGGPLASIVKVLDYTDKLDYLVIAHTTPVSEAGKIEFTGENIYTGLASKLGLIDRKKDLYNHPQVVDLSHVHHKLHAACAFYRSGFKSALAIVVDGAGTFIPLSIGGEDTLAFETETIFECSYPANFKTLLRHLGTRGPHQGGIVLTPDGDSDLKFPTIVSDRAGITKVYEAVTQYCGFQAIEAGKTMGLFPYGVPNDNIPTLFDKEVITPFPLSNRNLIVPTYPNAALVNDELYSELNETQVVYSHVPQEQHQLYGTASAITSGGAEDLTEATIKRGIQHNESVDQNLSEADVTLLQNRRDLAYACQIQTQEQVAKIIRFAVETTEEKNIVISGGYGLNCVANYYYLDALKDLDLNIYCEPVSNDAGTAMGAAFLFQKTLANDYTPLPRQDNLYLGPKYKFNTQQLKSFAKEYNADTETCNNEKIIDLITSKNIVAIFQGRSENGPRALGNRSLIFDPTFKDGKEHVNQIKRREYFRPFAGSILEEDVHEWFDLRGMESSPTMMYAVNCKEGIAEKIPSIIHVDGTCRIQTVNREQNSLYYDIIKCFKDKTGIPIVFNTSFNLGGEPLVETLQDALRTLRDSDLEYLYLPEYEFLFTVKNE